MFPYPLDPSLPHDNCFQIFEMSIAKLPQVQIFENVQDVLNLIVVTPQ